MAPPPLPHSKAPLLLTISLQRQLQRPTKLRQLPRLLLSQLRRPPQQMQLKSFFLVKVIPYNRIRTCNLA